MDHAGLFLSMAIIAPLMLWIGWDRDAAKPRTQKRLKTTPIRFASQAPKTSRSSVSTTPSTFEINP